MRRRAIKTKNLIITFLLTILGFGSACTDKGGISPAYGTPNQRYRVYGHIATAIGTRIPGIKVLMSYEFPLIGSDTTIYLRDTTSTISDFYGYYDVGITTYIPIKNFKVEFKDVDGIALREYQSKDTVVSFNDPEFKNGTGWYIGEASQKLDIKLKEKI